MITLNQIKPNATVLTVGTRTWYFSYQTCVAFEHRSTSKIAPGSILARARRQSNFSHMNYFGVSDWSKVDDATFERLAGGEL